MKLKSNIHPTKTAYREHYQLSYTMRSPLSTAGFAVKALLRFRAPPNYS